MANVAVTNTTANISGKTLVLAERDTTITGLETFDRDPSAPFAVSANSAVVTNLDADLLDGSEGSEYVHKTNDAVWTAYTPTWASSGTQPVLNNGTISGLSLQMGKIVFFRIAMTIGNTTTFGTGAYTWSIPVTASSTGGSSGTAAMFDAGGAGYYGGNVIVQSTTTLAIIPSAAGGLVSETVPFTWADGDGLNMAGFYIAA